MTSTGDLSISPGEPPLAGSARKVTLTLDLAGLGLLAAGLAWIYLSATVHGVDWYPLGSTYALAAAAFLGGRLVARLGARIVPAIIVSSAVVLWVGDPSGFLASGPSSYPFGYVNAKGAFLAQVAIALLVIAFSTTRSATRLVFFGAAIAVALMPLAFDSLAAGFLAIAALCAGVAIWRWERPQGLYPLVAIAFVVALMGTLLAPVVRGHVGLGFFEDALDKTVTQRRVMLWDEALGFMSNAPVFGIGPGNFESTSPLARSEEDIRWIPSLFLEAGAEAGVPAFLLTVSLVLWGLTRAWVTGISSELAVFGALALTVAAIHASMDYIVHFPAVPIAASALLGATTYRR